MEEYLTLTRAQVQFLNRYLPNHDKSSGMANFFSIFSDNTRLRILSALAIEEMCVGDIAYLLEINQTTVSHQLKLLRDNKIVACKRLGKILVYYLINPFVNDVICVASDHLARENGEYKLVN